MKFCSHSYATLIKSSSPGKQGWHHSSEIIYLHSLSLCIKGTWINRSTNFCLRLNSFSQQPCLPLTATTTMGTHTPFPQIFALLFVVSVWCGAFKRGPVSTTNPKDHVTKEKRSVLYRLSWETHSLFSPILPLLNSPTYQVHYLFSHFHLHLVYTAHHLDFSQLHCLQSFWVMFFQVLPSSYPTAVSSVWLGSSRPYR